MPDITSIAAITEREVSLISCFVDLLKDEQEVLKRGEAATLPDISARKITLVEELNSLELERGNALGITAEQNTRQAMSNWLAHNPNARSAAVNWENLLNFARQAKELHDLNARLVSIHLQQTSEALAVLTRQSEKNSLYGANGGQAAQTSGSRIVDSA